MSIRESGSSAESSAGQNPGGSHPPGCTGSSLLCISDALWRCSNGPHPEQALRIKQQRYQMHLCIPQHGWGHPQ